MKDRQNGKQMELRYVVADFENWKRYEGIRTEVRALEEDIRRQGIQILRPEQVCIQELPVKECLVLSEKKELLYRAKELGMAVVQLELPQLPESAGAGKEMLPVVLLSMEGIDFEWLNHIWQRKWNIPWQILTTKRCYLMELSLEDLDELYEIYGEEGMTDYVEPLYDRETEEAYERAYIENMYGFYGYGMWLIREKENGRLIGRAGLENHEYEGKWELELGYLIAKPYQRKGYAYEVCLAILQYAAENLEYETVCCRVEAENLPSVALAEKLGFYRCGVVQENGHCYDRYERKL